MHRYIIAALVTALVIFGVWYFVDIVSYILASVVLSLMGKPLVDLLVKIKFKGRAIPMWFAATVTVILMWGVVIALGQLFLPVLGSKLTALTDYNYSDLESMLAVPVNEFESMLNDKLSINLSADGSGILDMVHKWLEDLVATSVSSLDMVLDKVASFVIAAFSITFITFFFLREQNLFNQGIVLLFPRRYEENILRGLSSSITLLSRYFIGLLIESSVKLVVIALALRLVGFDFDDALLIALFSAILNVIPYIGPLLGVAVGLFIGLTSNFDVASLGSMMLTMTVIFAIFQTLDNVVMQPYLYSESVKAHPLEIYIVILMAGSLAGVWGMLLAIPIYTIIRVFAKEFFNNLRLVQKLTEKI